MSEQPSTSPPADPSLTRRERREAERRAARAAAQQAIEAPPTAERPTAEPPAPARPATEPPAPRRPAPEPSTSATGDDGSIGQSAREDPPSGAGIRPVPADAAPVVVARPSFASNVAASNAAASNAAAPTAAAAPSPTAALTAAVDATSATSATTLPTTATATDDATGDTSDQPDEEPHAPGPVAEGDIPDISTPQPPAGRNVPVAIAVGLGLGLLVVGSLFFWRKELFLGIAVLGCGVGLWELSRAVHVRDIKLPLLPLLVGTVGMMVSAYEAGIEALLVACVLTSGGAFVWRVLDGGGLPALRDATAAVFATCYIPFLGGFIALMLAADDGAWRVLTVIAVTVANDTGGYAAGVFFGKTRLAPIVSPKKSWEGLAGSYVAACAVGVGMMLGPLDGPWWAGLLLGVAGVSVATLGDLAESLLKRDLGVKDMGDLLPGHGGVLDRVDSLLFAAPVAFGVFYWVLGS